MTFIAAVFDIAQIKQLKCSLIVKAQTHLCLPIQWNTTQKKKKKDRDESQNNCADRKESEKKVHIVWLYFCETHENAPQ